MKKALLSLGVATGSVFSTTAQTYISPGLASWTMPAASTLAVYRPLKTSCYSYDSVSFPLISPTARQDLYVYSWEGENFVKNGLGWIRRDPVSGIVQNSGYFGVPISKYDMSVGIVTDRDGYPYVIASYHGPMGYTYDTYQWTPSGVMTATTPIKINVDSMYMINRISMDCYDLKKVVFTYDGRPQWYPDSTLRRQGGIYTRAMNIATTGTGYAPFNTSQGNERYIDSTGHWGAWPDVAIGRSGTEVTIPYINMDTPLVGYKTIYVRKTGFNNIFFGAGPVTMPLVDSIPAATSIYVANYGRHLRIDAPDHGPDVWSLVYNTDRSELFARTMPSSGIPVSKKLTNLLTLWNSQPTIAYNDSGTAINYGWYSQDAGAFISNKLYSNGTTFYPGTASGVYKKIDNVPFQAYILPVSFSRQNDRSKYLFTVYPYIQSGAVNYFDMRSKLAPWSSTAFRPEAPTSIHDAHNDLGLIAFPNPSTGGFTLKMEGYNGKKLSVTITDIAGKKVTTLEGYLDIVNAQLSTMSQFLVPGIYNISVTNTDYHKVLKVVKQ